MFYFSRAVRGISFGYFCNVRQTSDLTGAVVCFGIVLGSDSLDVACRREVVEPTVAVLPKK